MVSSSFAGVDDHDRQKRVWAVLKQELPREELVQVSFVLASTPEEEEALRQFPTDAD